MHFLSKAWISEQGPCFTAIEEDGGDKRLVQINKITTIKKTESNQHVQKTLQSLVIYSLLTLFKRY